MIQNNASGIFKDVAYIKVKTLFIIKLGNDKMLYQVGKNEITESIRKLIALEDNNLVGNANYAVEPFPIDDIILELLKNVELQEDFSSNNHFKALLDKYKTDHPGFMYTYRQLIADGWIRVVYGRVIIPYIPSRLIEVFEKYTYTDDSVVAFLLWYKKRLKRAELSVKICATPIEIIEKWKTIYPDLYDISWFEERYIDHMDDGWYLCPHYSHDDLFIKAMAKYWRLCKKKDEMSSWLEIAFRIHCPYTVYKYLNDIDLERLLALLIDKFTKSGKCNVSQVKRWITKSECLQYSNFPKEETKFNKNIFSDIWADDIIREERGYSERLLFKQPPEEAQDFVIHVIMHNLDRLSPEDLGRVSKVIISYDKALLLNDILPNEPENIAVMLLDENLIFIAIRSIVHYYKTNGRLSSDYLRTVENILEKSIETIRSNGHHPSADVLCTILMYLFEDAYISNMGRKFGKRVFDYACKLIGENFDNKLCAIADCFLSTLSTVDDYLLYKHIITLVSCYDMWFNKEEALSKTREKEMCEKMLSVIRTGLKRVLKISFRHFPIVVFDCLPDSVCRDMFDKYVSGESLSTQKDILYPKEIKKLVQEKDDQKENRYGVLFWLYILTQINKRDMVSAAIDIEYEIFSEVCIGEKALFSFDYVEVTNKAYEILNECLNQISGRLNECKSELVKLCCNPVADLVLNYRWIKDDGLRKAILETIQKRATNEDIYDSVIYDYKLTTYLLDTEGLDILYNQAFEHIQERAKTSKSEQWIPLLNHCLLKEKQYDEIVDGTVATSDYYIILAKWQRDGKSRLIYDALKRVIMNNDSNKYLPGASINSMLFLLADAEEFREGKSSVFDEYSLRKEAQSLNKKLVEERFWAFSEEAIRKYIYLYGLFLKTLDIFDYREIADTLSQTALNGEAVDIYADILAYDNNGASDSVINMTESSALYPSDEEIARAIISFRSFLIDKKGTFYYSIKRISVDPQIITKVFLTDRLLDALKIFDAFGPQVSGPEYDKNREDTITQLLREVFNRANADRFSLSVSDQNQAGTKGILKNGMSATPEIDLTIQYDGSAEVIVEALRLEKKTSKAVIQDHLRKTMGNNYRYHSFSFMLLYGVVGDCEDCWKKYEENILKYTLDMASSGSIKINNTEKKAFGDEIDDYYKKLYPGNHVIRQIVDYSYGAAHYTHEIIHIYADVSRLRLAALRQA